MTSTVNIASSIIDLIKDEIRDMDRPQVFKAEDGSRIVYYPKGDEVTVPGYTNPNSTEVSLISPSGAHVTVINYSAFFKDVLGQNPGGTGKKVSSICHLKSGKLKRGHVDGWRLAA